MHLLMLFVDLLRTVQSMEEGGTSVILMFRSNVLMLAKILMFWNNIAVPLPARERPES